MIATNNVERNPERPPMRPDLSHPIFGLADRMRSAVRTGRNLHLNHEHVQILMSESIYTAITNLEAEETRRACAAAATNDNRSGTIGSGSGQTREHGASVGLTALTVDPTGRGARLRLSEAMLDLQRRKRH